MPSVYIFVIVYATPEIELRLIGEDKMGFISSHDSHHCMGINHSMLLSGFGLRRRLSEDTIVKSRERSPPGS